MPGRCARYAVCTGSLDATTSEAFAATINRYKGKVTLLFIAHHLPPNLQVDVTVQLGRKQTGSSEIS